MRGRRVGCRIATCAVAALVAVLPAGSAAAAGTKPIKLVCKFVSADDVVAAFGQPAVLDADQPGSCGFILQPDPGRVDLEGNVHVQMYSSKSAKSARKS